MSYSENIAMNRTYRLQRLAGRMLEWTDRRLSLLEPGAAKPRLAVIIVNYESWPDVDRLVGSLASEPEFVSGRCPVVVVDNASRGPIPAADWGLPADLRIIFRPDNGGFAVGVNAGWRAADSRWLLVLNPDVEVTNGFLGRVFGRLDHYEADPSGPPGIVGFGLKNPDGSPQGSVGAFPSLARSIWEQFFRAPAGNTSPVGESARGPSIGSRGRACS